MIITKFTKEHIKEALEIARLNYEEERIGVPELPKNLELPSLDYYAENGLGVAAIENDKLIGYLCVYKPWQGAFDTFDSLGTYSPIHANGTIKENRYRIIQDMVEVAYENWASLGIVSVGIGLYAHNEIAKKALFEYGFGMRCKDRIKTIQKGFPTNEYQYKELSVDEFPIVRDMRYHLDQHLKKSPCFLQETKEEYLNWLNNVEQGDRRTFIISNNKEIMAYIDITEEGENFITNIPMMANINGAYCKPEYRGMHIMDELLKYVSNKLISEGVKLLGVDHESYNPSGNRFWDKYFKEYTNSVVKKIENWSVGK